MLHMMEATICLRCKLIAGVTAVLHKAIDVFYDNIIMLLLCKPYKWIRFLWLDLHFFQFRYQFIFIKSRSSSLLQ